MLQLKLVLSEMYPKCRREKGITCNSLERESVKLILCGEEKTKPIAVFKVRIKNVLFKIAGEQKACVLIWNII